MDVFVERPVLAIAVSLALLLTGLRAAIEIPVLQFPKVDSSSLVITTGFRGASADVVQGFITDPVERAAASVPGIDYLDSSTVAGRSTVTAWLEINEDSTDALAELSARLSQIRFELPAAADDPAIEVQRADRPNAGFYLEVTMGERSRADVTDYLNRRVTPVISAIPGVQRVGLEGGRLPAMRVWLDPQRMATSDVSAFEVLQALEANNIIATVGRSENENRRIDLLANTTLQTLADFERMVIRDNDGALIRLGDVARLELGEEEGDFNARLDNEGTVFISVWPLPGANEIEIADHLYELLDELNPGLPEGMHVGVGYDVTLYMRDALREIFTTLAETVLLVGLVVLAMMGSFRTALVPLVTIPISLLGAVAAMSLMGFSLNLLTVLAIVLSVGLVVDDAIVVVENVARHMREGAGRREAALASSRELLGPIIGMTVTLAAVYAPLGFLSGLTGAFFREFAFTLATAVMISGVVALTLSPIMSAYACAPGGLESRPTLWVNRQFAALERRYAGWLDTILAWRPQLLVLGTYLALLSVPFYLFSQQELAPTEDQSAIAVIIEAPPEASLDYTTRHMDDVVNTMLALPGARFMWQIVTPNSGFGGLELEAAGDRSGTTDDLLFPAFAALAQVQGLKAFPVLPPALPSAGNFDVEMVVLSSDAPRDMKPYADQLVANAYASGRFLFADTDLKIDLPQARFVLDRERIADLGMTVADVSRQLSVLLSADYVNRFDFDGKAYQVIPLIEDQGRPDPQALLDQKLRTPDGDLVPLSAIATMEQQAAPRLLGRFQRKNSFRVFGGLIPGTTKEQGLAALEQAAREILPVGYTLDYAGESRQLRKQGSTLMGVLGIALVFVYLVLAVQFNSFRDPLVVLLGSVPLALSGALVFAFLGWTSINIFSQVGCITLVGLIAKNGILIVEFANRRLEEGMERERAIRDAACTRLRPVLMTTFATVFGHFPLVLVTGAGAEARNSIGIVLVAGMLIGTLFTLVILPCVYLALAGKHRVEGVEGAAPATA